MMNELTKLACGAAALALVLGATAETTAGRPGDDKARTQACVLTGDATGGGQVGIDAKSDGSLEMTISADTSLARVFDLLGVSSYSGLGRVLKREGRLDFYFGVEEPDCRPAEWGEQPGPGTGICRYRLILLNGVYARKAGTVEFAATGGADAALYDNWMVPGDPLLASGTADLVVRFEG
jgi:hypothetical protein